MFRKSSVLLVLSKNEQLCAFHHPNRNTKTQTHGTRCPSFSLLSNRSCHSSNKLLVAPHTIPSSLCLSVSLSLCLCMSRLLFALCWIQAVTEPKRSRHKTLNSSRSSDSDTHTYDTISNPIETQSDGNQITTNQDNKRTNNNNKKHLRQKKKQKQREREATTRVVVRGKSKAREKEGKVKQRKRESDSQVEQNKTERKQDVVSTRFVQHSFVPSWGLVLLTEPARLYLYDQDLVVV